MRANFGREDRIGSVVPWDRWFVGLQLSNSWGAMGEHCYIVGEAADADDAVAIALLRAAAAHECAASGKAKIDRVEARRLRGWAYLGRPLCVGAAG
ncbi:hypothetical protein ABZ208_30320 [Streptomyces sp. NPDC006208]|uniref:hypothetical protein n=1 Tax=Streptomyces sp. NPDC006208 TaxID=3156734 RepID=UPI0033BDF6C1